MAKQIAWAPDRAAAIKRMEQALAAFEIEGVTTSLPLLSRILAHPVFQHNTVTTHWLNELLTKGELMTDIKLVDVSLRDGNQSIWGATGVTTRMVQGVAPCWTRWATTPSNWSPAP